MDSRYLVTCSACTKAYDVSRVAPGTEFACACGATVRARHRAPHTPRVSRCSNCGGPLAEGARACAYCCAEITIDERRLTSVCPHCFARAAADARFCMECGVGLESAVPEASAVGVACPRCRGDLRSRTIEEAPVLECTSCAGAWLEPEHFDFLCRRARNQARMRTEPERVLVERPADSHPMAYLPCPECDDYMVRRNFGGTSGIMIDVCRTHGVWLDHGELPRIVRWIREGGDPDRGTHRERSRSSTRASTGSGAVDLGDGLELGGRRSVTASGLAGGLVAGVEDLFGFLSDWLNR